MMPTSYRNIAVASTFSPRFVHVLAEAKRIVTRLGSRLNVIYVGERTEETDQKFSGVLQQLGLPLDSTIYYAKGDPADGILRALTDNAIDMIVAGALEKEVTLHQFLGNVARRLVREASCSVMLFTEPNLEPKPLNRMVFVADYSDHGREALKQAIDLAAREQTERLYVIRIITTFDEIRAARETSAEPASTSDEEIALEEFVLSTGATEVPIEVRCIRGNTGLAASDFVQSVSADILVVPISSSPDQGRNLPPNIAWITDVIPCNLWVIR